MSRIESADTWWLAVAIAAFAVIAGQTVMVLGGAPTHMPWINFAAMLAAAALFPAQEWVSRQALRLSGATLILAAAAVLATAFLGTEVEGVRRWVGPAPLAIHVSHVAAPLAIAAAAAAPGPLAAAALVLMSLGLALQPDAAAAASLALALLALFALRRSAWTGASLAAALGAAVWTGLNPDGLAPVAFVEYVPQTALALGWPFAVLVAVGLVLLPTPFVFVAVRGRRRRPLAAALAAYWIGLIAASLALPFPSPLVGYGVGPILGYVLSWALLRGSGMSPAQMRR